MTVATLHRRGRPSSTDFALDSHPPEIAECTSVPDHEPFEPQAIPETFPAIEEWEIYARRHPEGWERFEQLINTHNIPFPKHSRYRFALSLYWFRGIEEVEYVLYVGGTGDKGPGEKCSWYIRKGKRLKIIGRWEGRKQGDAVPKKILKWFAASGK